MSDTVIKKNSDKEEYLSYTEIVKVFGIDVKCPFCNYELHLYVDKAERCPECDALLHLVL